MGLVVCCVRSRVVAVIALGCVCGFVCCGWIWLLGYLRLDVCSCFVCIALGTLTVKIKMLGVSDLNS